MLARVFASTYFFAAALSACAPQSETAYEKRPTIDSGPNRYHDLTDFNYVTVWVNGLHSTAALICELNDQANPCLTFIRPTHSGILKETELYLPALPFGNNHFEIQRADGSPLAVTDFEVCRRTLEIDFGPGPDGFTETPDDTVERVRRRAWKNRLAAWDAIYDGTGTKAIESREHSWAFRTTDTVRKLDSNGETIERQGRLFTFHGIPISSETYSPLGNLMQYQRFCTHSDLTFFVPSNEEYSDGACRGFVPSYQETFAHPGSDQTWRTADDTHFLRTNYYFLSGSEWLATAAPGSEWLRTIFAVAPTNATRTNWDYSAATVTKEVHQRDLARPGLWVRTMLTRKNPGQDEEQLGYRKYEYQCVP